MFLTSQFFNFYLERFYSSLDDLTALDLLRQQVFFRLHESLLIARLHGIHLLSEVHVLRPNLAV